jgi:nitrate reductase assembly molybdenum cofactor insertion protein NarJ
MKQQERTPSSAQLLDKACRWRMLSLLLSRPSRERKSEVSELAREIPDARLAEVAHAWCDNATEGAYLQLLGPGGLVPARAGAYRPFADPGWILADLARYHRAFGFHATAEEPPDHVAVLADFVSYLLLKEAYARESGALEAVAITRDAMERFIDEHLSPVAARIAERLDACGATDWSAAAYLLAEKVPAPRPSAAAPAQDDEALQCGGCATARGGQG